MMAYIDDYLLKVVQLNGQDFIDFMCASHRYNMRQLHEVRKIQEMMNRDFNQYRIKAELKKPFFDKLYELKGKEI